tara:strand:+ start:1150 stop:1278 length:129 start_codon:yes stop_codon:yes gene_type:complete
VQNNATTGAIAGMAGTLGGAAMGMPWLGGAAKEAATPEFYYE